MNSCHNFAFLSPLQALDEFNSGHFFDGQSSIETIWLILSQLDVDSIQDNELEQISAFWCSSVVTAKIYNFTKKPKTTTHLFYSYCLIVQVAFSLYQRLLKKSLNSQDLDLKNHLYDPIMAVFGFLDHIFDEIETPSNYPIKFSPIFDNSNSVIEFFRQHSDLPQYNIIISWGLRFLFSPIYYSNKDDNNTEIESFNQIKELIDPDGYYFFDVKAQLQTQKQTNSESDNNNNNNDNDNKQVIFDRFIRTDSEIPLVSILLVRYSLSKFFNIQIVAPIAAPNADFYDNFYNKVILNSNDNTKGNSESNENIQIDSSVAQGPSEEEIIHLGEEIIKISQTFLYVSANKIQFPSKLFVNHLIPTEFITLSFLSDTIDDSQIDIHQIFEREPSSRNSVLFLLSKLKTADEIDQFTEFLNSKQFSDGWINEARGCMLGFEPIDRLINDSISGDSNAAKALLDHPECKESLTPSSSVLHKILSILLSNDPVELPEEYPQIAKPEPEPKPEPSEENSNAQNETNAEGQAESKKDDKSASVVVEVPAIYNYNAAIIYKAIQHKHKLNFKPLIAALHAMLIDVVDSITKKRGLTYLVLAGFKPNDESDAHLQHLQIPQDAKDLIVDLTKKPLSMIFMNVYMYLYYIEITGIKDSLDEWCLNLLADFSSNYFFSSYLERIVRKTMPASFLTIVSQHRISHITNSLKDKGLRTQILDLILPTIKSEHSSQITDLVKFFIDDDDIESIITLLSDNPPSIRDIISSIPIEIQDKIFDNLIEKGDQNKMKLIVPLILETNPSLFKKLGVIALKTPKLLDSLLTVCNCSNEAFIEAVSSFSGEITTEFAQMLKKLVHSLPIYLIAHQLKEGEKERQRMNVDWNDEVVSQSTQTKTVDPWIYNEDETDQIKEHNTGNHHCFFCYTCGIFGDRNNICLNCALKCHKGHDIAYYGLTESPCACGKKSSSTCKINKASSNENETQEASKTPKQHTTITTTNAASTKKTDNNNNNNNNYKVSVKYFDACNDHNISLLITLFRSLLNSKIMKPPDPLQVIRLTTGSIFDVDITKFHSSFTPSRFKFATVQSNPNETAAAHTGGSAGGTDGGSSLPISLLPKLIDSQSIINEVQNQSSTYERHFEYRSRAIPIQAAAVGGPLCNILVVASGRTLTSFNIETMQQLSTYRMSHPGFQISFCPLDPSVFAVASLKHVMIFSLTENGTFQESEQIMLLLEELSPTIFVNSVVWVPLECLHLAVVCNMFIKIYDIPSDRFSPIACFFADSPNFFSSAVFVEHEEECYGLFAMSTGRIAIQNTNVDPSDGPIPLTRFATFPRFSNHQLTLSYSPESDILFISSPPQPLLAMRLDEIFKEKDPQFLAIDIPQNLIGLHLYFVHCVNGSLHFLVNPNSGAVFTIEFIDNEQVEVSSLSPQSIIPMGGIPIYDRSIITLTTFTMQNKLYAIGKNGKILALQSADESNDDDDEEGDKENEDEENDEDEDENGIDSKANLFNKFIVPPSFWTISKIASKFLIEISAHNIQSDPSILLSGIGGGGFVFPGEIRHKCLDVSIKDDNLLIVGFRITVGLSNPSLRNRPSYIKVFNRKYSLHSSSSSSPYTICVPLRPEEIRLRRRYRLGIGNNESNDNYDIFIDSLDVFTIRVDQLDAKKYSWIKRSKEIDWFKDGNNVFDFNDSRQIVKISKSIKIDENHLKGRNPRIFKRKIKLGNDVMSYLINNISLAFPLEFEMDDNTIGELVGIMYGNPDISMAARRMIIKGAKLFGADSDRKYAVLKIWADTICKLVNDGKINDKQWGLLWRDLALMPQDLKDAITPIVWKSKPQLSGTFTALSAFLTK